MKENCRKKLFISGPVMGVPYAWKAFDEARVFYMNMGYAVTVPTDLPVGMSNADYARICFSMIDSADEVAFLPGWSKSDRARLEWDYCGYIGKPRRVYEDDVENGRPKKPEEHSDAGMGPRKEKSERAALENGLLDKLKKANLAALGPDLLAAIITGKDCGAVKVTKETDVGDAVKIEGGIDLTALGAGAEQEEADETCCDEKSFVILEAVEKALGRGYQADLSLDENGWLNVGLYPPKESISK